MVGCGVAWGQGHVEANAGKAELGQVMRGWPAWLAKKEEMRSKLIS